MIIFGSMYQLVPVVLEVKLFGERIATIQFWIYSIGVIGLVYGFWFFKIGLFLTIFASLTAIGIYFFVFNMSATLLKVTKWNITGWFILAGIFYLTITATAGLLLSINLGYPFIDRLHLDYLKMHAHLGFIGWVLMVIMGVALKLIPMFGLSHGYSTRPSMFTFYFVNLGLLGIILEWLLAGPEWLFTLYLSLLVIGIICFLIQLFFIFRHRMKKKLDLGMKHSANAFLYLFLCLILGFVMSIIDLNDFTLRETIILIYGFMILFGFFSTLIIGQMYKIVPFLVWFHTFSDRVGKEQVPMLKDMFSEKIGMLQWWILNLSYIAVIAGLIMHEQLILHLGFIMLMAASFIFVYNMIHIFQFSRSYGHSRKNI